MLKIDSRETFHLNVKTFNKAIPCQIKIFQSEIYR